MKKNKIYSILSLMLMAFSLVGTSCRQEESPSIDDYPLNYKITPVTLTKSAKVGAIYVNNPFANTNAAESQYARLTSPYDVSDLSNPKLGSYVRPVLQRYNVDVRQSGSADLFQQHLDWAKEAGIDFLIMPAVGYDANQPSSLNINSLNNFNFFEGISDVSRGKIDWHGIEFCIQAQPSGIVANTSNSKMVEDDKDENGHSENIAKLCKYFVGLADRFFRDDSLYYRVDGKPVLIITQPQDLHCRDSKAVYDSIRSAVREAAGVELYLVARQNQWTPTARFINSFVSGGFDAFYMNTMYNDVTPQRAGEMRPIYIDQNWQYNSQWAKENANLDFIPSVSPAFNAWVSDANRYAYPIENYNEERFRTMCNVAKKNLSANNMVIIDSFNDWVNSTAIEPTDPYYGNGYGMKMLEIVKSEFKVNE